MERASVPLDLQVSCPEIFGKTRCVRFMGDLLALLGAHGAIGPRMAVALTEWGWPPLLDEKDPSWKWLYIAQQSPLGIVKIGLSSDPLRRMTALPGEYGDGGAFDLLAVVPRCGLAHERALCSLFTDSRLRGNEWFRSTKATRILCWNAAAQRNPSKHDAEWERLGRALVCCSEALAWLCDGRISPNVRRRIDYVEREKVRKAKEATRRARDREARARATEAGVRA